MNAVQSESEDDSDEETQKDQVLDNETKECLKKALAYFK